MSKLYKTFCFLLLAAASCLLAGCHAATTHSARPVSQRAGQPVADTGTGAAQHLPTLPEGQRDQYGQPPLRAFPPMPNSDNKPLFLHNGNIVRTVSSGGTYRFWDVKTGRLIRVQPTGRPCEVVIGKIVSGRPVYGDEGAAYVAVSEDVTLGALMANQREGSGDVQLRDIPHDRSFRILHLPHFWKPADHYYGADETSVQFGHTARTCAVSDSGTNLTLWNCQTGRLQWSRLLPHWPAAQNMLSVAAIVFSPNDHTLAVVQQEHVGSEPGDIFHFVTILDTATGSIKRRWSKKWGGYGIYLLAPDNKTFLNLVGCSGNFALGQCNITNGHIRAIHGIYDQAAMRTEMVGAAFAADSRRIATCFSDAVNYDNDYPLHVSVTDIPSGRCVAGYDFTDTTTAGYYMPDMALSPNGRMLAVTNHRGVLTLWQVPPVQKPAQPNPTALRNKSAPVVEQLIVTK